MTKGEPSSTPIVALDEGLALKLLLPGRPCPARDSLDDRRARQRPGRLLPFSQKYSEPPTGTTTAHAEPRKGRNGARCSRDPSRGTRSSLRDGGGLRH